MQLSSKRNRNGSLDDKSGSQGNSNEPTIKKRASNMKVKQNPDKTKIAGAA